MTSWYAPGRVNLIGEHTDYNDGFVLPMALAMGCTARIETAPSGWIARSHQQPELVSVPRGGRASTPAWARYVLGAVWLLNESGVDVPPLAITVDSDVPSGAGLSSSAALVCSVVCALDDHLDLSLGDDRRLALARAVENDVVGAPTGGMDQLISLRGSKGHALLCDMRTLHTEPVPFDPPSSGLQVLVVDTRAPHRHVDGEYAARRQACEAAARTLGVAALRDVVSLEGALTRLDADLRPYVRHVVTENARVLETAALLRAGEVRAVGPLLSASHASMRDDFAITVPEVDQAVEALLEAGAHGARMTGGGFGGCVIALVEETDVPRAEEAVRQAFARSGYAAPVSFVAAACDGARRV